MKSETMSNKKPYSKPCLRKLELAPDEVLAAGCKTATSAPITGKATNPTCLIPVPVCSTTGS